MSVTGTSILGSPLANLRTLFGSLAAFQTWTGEATAAAARGHVYIHQFDDTYEAGDSAAAKAASEALRPIVVIGHEEFDSESDDQSGYWPKTGTIRVALEQVSQNENAGETGDDVATSDACMDLLNNVGAIMTELEAAIAAGGTFDGIGWTIIMPVGRIQPKDRRSGALDLTGIALQMRRRDS